VPIASQSRIKKKLKKVTSIKQEARSDNMLPSHIFFNIYFNIIISSHLRMGLPKHLFSSAFPNKFAHAFSSLHIYITCLVHVIPLMFAEYRLRNSTLCSAFHRPVTASVLSSRILLHYSTYLKRFHNFL
jgi:hypothetical protein